jgi:hypothetical protein
VERESAVSGIGSLQAAADARDSVTSATRLILTGRGRTRARL